MSKEAPWIALAIDWQDSVMFDDSTEGVRLAWICLLCEIRETGRHQPAFDPVLFAAKRRLDIASVNEMVSRALAFNQIKIHAGRVRIVDRLEWKWFRKCSLALKKRRRILERDGYICRYCGMPARTIDHIHPVAKGGGSEDENLAAACSVCNTKKGPRTPDEAGMRLS